MRFLRQLTLREPEECAEIVELNLAGVEGVPAFACVVVHGVVDEPAQLDLYKTRLPEYNEKPIAVYVRSGMGMVRQ